MRRPAIACTVCGVGVDAEWAAVHGRSTHLPCEPRPAEPEPAPAAPTATPRPQQTRTRPPQPPAPRQPAAGRVITSLEDLETDDEELAWQERALCAQTDPEMFFPEKGGSTKDAKGVCYSCEVRLQCLGYALDNDERFGIWGGLSERERRKAKRERGDQDDDEDEPGEPLAEAS